MNKVLAPLLALILVVTARPVTPAQTSLPAQQATNAGPQDWQGLRDLKPGKKVLIEFKSGIGDPVERKFVSAIGSTLTVSDAGYMFQLEQRDIKRVYHLKGKWSRGKAARVGGVIGGLVGLVVGIDINIRTKPPDTSPGPQLMVLGALAGRGVGALLGGKDKGILLYETK